MTFLPGRMDNDFYPVSQPASPTPEHSPFAVRTRAGSSHPDAPFAPFAPPWLMSLRTAHPLPSLPPHNPTCPNRQNTSQARNKAASRSSLVTIPSVACHALVSPLRPAASGWIAVTRTGLLGTARCRWKQGLRGTVWCRSSAKWPHRPLGGMLWIGGWYCMCARRIQEWLCRVREWASRN